MSVVVSTTWKGAPRDHAGTSPDRPLRSSSPAHGSFPGRTRQKPAPGHPNTRLLGSHPGGASAGLRPPRTPAGRRQPRAVPPVPSRSIPPPRGCGTAAPWAAPGRPCPHGAPQSPPAAGSGLSPSPLRAALGRSAGEGAGPHRPAELPLPGRGHDRKGRWRPGAGVTRPGHPRSASAPLRSCSGARPLHPAAPTRIPGGGSGAPREGPQAPPRAPGAVLARPAWAWRDAAGLGTSREPWPGVPTAPQGGSQRDPRSARGQMNLGP